MTPGGVGVKRPPNDPFFLVTFYDVCARNKKEEQNLQKKNAFLVHPNHRVSLAVY